MLETLQHIIQRQSREHWPGRGNDTYDSGLTVTTAASKMKEKGFGSFAYFTSSSFEICAYDRSSASIALNRLARGFWDSR